MVSKTLAISLAFSLVSAHLASASLNVERGHKEPEDKLKKFIKKLPVAGDILTKRQIPGQGGGGIPGVPGQGGQAAQPAMGPEQVEAMMQAAEVINKWLGAWNDQNHKATKRQAIPVDVILGSVNHGLHEINGGLNSAGRAFRGSKREEGGDATAEAKEGEQSEGEKAEGSDAERHAAETQGQVAYPVSGTYETSLTSSAYEVSSTTAYEVSSTTAHEVSSTSATSEVSSTYPTTTPTYPEVSMSTSESPAEETTSVEEKVVEATTTIQSTTLIYSTVVHYSEGTPAMTYHVEPYPTYSEQAPTTLITQRRTSYVTVPAAPTESPVPETKQPEEHEHGVPISGQPTEEHKEEVPPTEEQPKEEQPKEEQPKEEEPKEEEPKEEEPKEEEPKEEPTEEHDTGIPIKGEPEEKHDTGIPIKGEPGHQTPGDGSPYPSGPSSDYPSAPHADYPSAPHSDYPSGPQSNHTSGGPPAGYPASGWMGGESNHKAHGDMKPEQPKAHDGPHAEAHPDGYIMGSDPAGYGSLQGGAGGQTHEGSDDKKHHGADGKKHDGADGKKHDGNGYNAGGYGGGYTNQNGAADDKKQSTGSLGLDTLAKLGLNFQAHRR